MNCPIDHSGLNYHEQGGIAFHYCGECHGMFFNKKNLLACLRAGNVATESSKSPRVGADVTSKVVKRECPSCHAATMCDKLLDEIAIDICPECKGVWLDAGELDKIVERHHRKHGDGNKGRDDYDDVAQETGALLEDSDLMGDTASAVGEFFGDAGEWLGEAGSSVGDFFTLDF